jgi:phosphatidylserine synthase 2
MRNRSVVGGDRGKLMQPEQKSRTATSTSVVVVPRTSPYLSEVDFIDFVYKPHTLTAMVILVSTLFALWKWQHLPGGDMLSSVKLGLAAAAWVFVVFGTIHLPDGLMLRPHPIFWRFVLSVAILYLMLIAFLTFQDLATVKQLFAWYDPIHTVVHPEQSYANDCRLSTPEEPMKFWTTIFDIFLLAHSMGYWAKMVVIRDWRIVTAVSLGFELVEVTFQHQLPNFKECWWDHVICDILICNGGGTVLGYITLKLFGAKPYHWARLEDIPTLKGKAQRVLKQFTPRSFDTYNWHMFESAKRFTQVCLLLAVFTMNEINCFTMKSILNQKPTYHLVPMRLVMWGFLAVPGLREYYCYISDPTVKRLGTFAWVGTIALFMETVFIAKMTVEGQYFKEPTPASIGIPWIIAGSMMAVWVVLYFGVPCLRKIFVTRLLLNVLYFGAFLVLLAMCCMANTDTQWYLEEFNAFVNEHRLWEY